MHTHSRKSYVIIFYDTGDGICQPLAGDLQREALIDILICESVVIFFRNRFQHKFRLFFRPCIGRIVLIYPVRSDCNIAADIRFRRHLFFIERYRILISVIGHRERVRRPGRIFIFTVTRLLFLFSAVSGFTRFIFIVSGLRRCGISRSTVTSFLRIVRVLFPAAISGSTRNLAVCRTPGVPGSSLPLHTFPGFMIHINDFLRRFLLIFCVLPSGPVSKIICSRILHFSLLLILLFKGIFGAVFLPLFFSIFFQPIAAGIKCFFLLFF